MAFQGLSLHANIDICNDKDGLKMYYDSNLSGTIGTTTELSSKKFRDPRNLAFAWPSSY
jgi:hypothetical protein